MIEYPLSIACQLLDVDKHKLKYWQEQLDPHVERHGYSFPALLAYSVISFLINDAGYTVMNLKKFGFERTFSDIEAIAGDISQADCLLSLNYRKGRFELSIGHSSINVKDHQAFPLIDLTHLNNNLQKAFRLY